MCLWIATISTKILNPPYNSPEDDTKMEERLCQSSVPLLDYENSVQQSCDSLMEFQSVAVRWSTWDFRYPLLSLDLLRPCQQHLMNTNREPPQLEEQVGTLAIEALQFSPPVTL
ncbi:hypothetical protein HUJ04_005165 [Dendroctonus ponderosae]|nr:hypothetical protein HUJ04_005165 [Dendroctonus ponderosae]